MKKFARVMTIMTLICSIMAAHASAAFTDVPETHWAANYVTYAEAYGLINGIGNGKFAPNETLTEAHCCQIVYNSLVTPIAKSSSSKWYTDAVNWVEHSLGKSINPERTATRLFVCELVKQFVVPPAPATTTSLRVPFSDTNKLTDSEKSALRWCWEAEIIDGFPDGTFRPYDGLTRAQGAKIFALWHHLNNEGATPDPAKPMSIKQLSAAEADTMGRYAKALGWDVTVAPWPHNHDDGTYWFQIVATNQNGKFDFLVGGSDHDGPNWFHVVEDNKEDNGFKPLSKESVKASFEKWA